MRDRAADRKLIVEALAAKGWRDNLQAPTADPALDVHLSYRNPLGVIVDLKRLVQDGHYILTIDDRRASDLRAIQIVEPETDVMAEAIVGFMNTISVGNYFGAYSELSMLGEASILMVEQFDPRLFAVGEV